MNNIKPNINNKLNKIIYSNHAIERLNSRNINKSAINKLINVDKKLSNHKFLQNNIGSRVKAELSINDSINLQFSSFDYDQIQQLKYLVVVIAVLDIDTFLVVTCFEKMTINEFNKSKSLIKVRRREVFT
tara:strand:- start:937 stop:1326 length:390 start_codon:yes stop_codon:yes gene_type:complete